MPGDSNIYYLFHETYTYSGWADHILYSTIDMRLDSGRGAVTNKNIPIINDTLAGGMITATRHANGRDWWIAIPEMGGGRIFVFLLSPAGITDLHAQQVQTSNNHMLLNQAIFSPDGSIYARSEYMDGGFYVYDFDRCTGTFSNSRNVPQTPIKPGGLAISPNSKVIYLTAVDTILQYDLTAANIASTEQIVAVYDSFASPFGSTFFLQQLAPDGKIYISCTNGENVMHSIDYPDSLGSACHVCLHCVQLPAYNAFGIPNYPNFRLGALVGSPCDTLQIGVVEVPNIISGKIFPNPARDWIVFETAQAFKESASLTIYNMLGEQIYQQQFNAGQMRYSVNISGIAEGMYIVKVNNAKGVMYNGKLVIQK
jgi:DNA-binding beta-propeller fold protein YncE